MLNALLVVIRPEIGWARIARREKNFLAVALVEWFLFAVVSVLVESWSMVKFGAGTNSIGGIYSLSFSRIINYEINYLLLSFIFVCIASIFIYFSVKKELSHCSFSFVFSIVVYLSCPVFFVKFIDAVPSVNTWACFIASNIIIMVTTYVAIPKTLFPNVTDGFSMYLVIVFLLCGMLFCCHFISVMSLKLG
jgi:hypothetical protein